MDHINQIEKSIDGYIKDWDLTSPKTLRLILNRTYITKHTNWTTSSTCLYLITKYKGLHWPELCVDDSNIVVLFIGIRE